MSRGVDPVSPSATVQEAATQMAEFDVGAVLVGDDTGLVGVLTDRDVILRVVVEGRHPAEVAVKDAMSGTLFTCKEDDSVESVVAEMRERQIRRMPVLDEAGKTVGIVTLSDLAKAFSGPEQVQEAIRAISEPHRRRDAPEPGPPAGKEAEQATAEEGSEESDEAAKRG
jgi:signal-transduction protein with cAMP-binding, CBS, and nucleotidyltransferase domain